MRSINHTNKPLQCGSTFSGSSHWHSSVLQVLSSLAQRMTFNLKKVQIVSALRETLVTLPASLVNKGQVLVLAATVNTRVYTGLVLIFLAPVLALFYTLFEPTGDFLGYHLNWYFLLMNIGPYLWVISTLIGVYHLFPYKSWEGKVLIVPAGMALAKMLSNILATSNEEYNTFPSVLMILIAFTIVTTILLSIDRFAWAQFHGADNITSTLEGLMNPTVKENTDPLVWEAKMNDSIKKLKGFLASPNKK
jgi:hypothetical protein